MLRSFDSVLESVQGKPKKTIALAMAEEDDVLLAVDRAHRAGLADAVLVGDRKKIRLCAERHGIDLNQFDIVHAEGEFQSVVRAIQLVREHLADTLMKGKCSTATLLKGVLQKDHGLRSGKLLCHMAIFETPHYHKLLFMSDAAMNIEPDLGKKVLIVENAVAFYRALTPSIPKLALITAVEKVNPGAMLCTEHAAIIAQMARRGQIADVIVDGPLAVDNAVSSKSCATKGIDSPVGGDADILIMPDIEAANVFYKTLTYLGGSKTAGLIIGAQVPIVLTSRADSDETKFLSIALAMAASGRTMTT
ncbi:bifunctional enoyl-CoA hydratase/phosphate acetyltransferase [candidate division KSB1 bacterium]|nr:bifunctional enoyl-CoA hydratase/phosphate acetyltransferase [candidate division KSB1 bacterium]